MIDDTKMRVSLWLPTELMDTVKTIAATGDLTPSEVIRKSLERDFSHEAAERLRKSDIVRDVTVATGEKFVIPVGDVVCAGMPMAQSQLWWCPADRISYVQSLCAEWEKHGFKLHVGRDGRGTPTMPEVIEEEWQERGKNKRYAPSCKGIEARVGDSQVWLTIEHAEKALVWLSTRTDIPVAVRCDVHKYSDDDVYQKAFDRANECFLYYWTNERPMRIHGDVRLTEEDVADIYGV